MKAKFTLEMAIAAFEHKRLTYKELASALGCGLDTSANLIQRLRDLRKLVIHGFKPPETQNGKGTSAPVYRLRMKGTDRDARRPTKDKDSVQRREYTLERKLQKLKEERYIALTECSTEVGREEVRKQFAKLIRDAKEEPKEMQREYKKKSLYAKKGIGESKLLIERQPSLAMCWSTPVKSEEESE